MTTPTLSQVQSFAYIIGANAGETAVARAIGASAAQMVMVGDGVGSYNLNRSIADPNNNKVILGYIDMSEANVNVYPQLDPGGVLPSWFGPQLFANQYSIQYWNPAWETAVFGEIDKIATAGYDGVFLDSISGYAHWQAGNGLGNPVYADAVSAMAILIQDIRTHIDSAAFASITHRHPFYLVGNNPGQVAVDFPATVGALDGVFNEQLYYSTGYLGAGNANYVSTIEAPVYRTLGLPVFGNDYPPLGDRAADFTSFAYYTAMGWVPSVQTTLQKTDLFTSGPYQAMATPGNATVTGVKTLVNFLSGGLQLNATLIGGDKGDDFIGGPGQNTIVGGAGADTIYAHPATAAFVSALKFKFTAQDAGSVGLPQVQIKVNGHLVLGPATITATSGSSQEIDIDAVPLGAVSSIEIDALGVSFINANNFNTVYLTSAAFNTQPLSTSAAARNASALLQSNDSVLLNKAGVISWSAAAIPPPPPAVNTSDTISGGGGLNTVVYRGGYSQYAITRSDDGVVHVVAKATAEGPDDLTNIQTLQFTDETIDVASLFGGNNILKAIPGAGALVGGGFLNTVVFASASRVYAMSINAGVETVSGGPESANDTLTSIQRVQFADGYIATGPSDTAGQVYRLYQATLNRPPDSVGLANWVHALNGGQTLQSVIDGFTGSTEFQAIYGALDNAGFITLLYNNVLHRAPDTGGLDSWLSFIAASHSRSEVVYGFSESAEGIAALAAPVQAGLWVQDAGAAEVARLYDTVLGRLPDAAGLTAWTHLLDSGADTLLQVTQGFVGSTEFQAVYGALNDSQFVGQLYLNTLHRAADQSGLTNWVNFLAAGHSRSEVVVGFSESAEHIANTAAHIDQGVWLA